MAGGHQVAGLPVRSVTDLLQPSALCPDHSSRVPIDIHAIRVGLWRAGWRQSYLGHSSLALEPPADAVVDSLGFAP